MDEFTLGNVLPSRQIFLGYYLPFQDKILFFFPSKLHSEFEPADNGLPGQTFIQQRPGYGAVT